MAAGLLLATTTASAADGSFDPAFGSGGVVRMDSDPAGGPSDVAVLSDGRIVIAGYDVNPASSLHRWRLRCLQSDGSSDANFGSGGSLELFGTVGHDVAQDVAVDASGRLLVAGDRHVTITTGTGRRAQTLKVYYATVVRLDAWGNLDSTFGNAGVATIAISGTFTPNGSSTQARALVVQPDGRILVGGNAVYAAGKSGYQTAAFVARLTSNGAMDGTFGSSGVSVVDLTSGHDRVHPSAMALQSNGKVVFGGSAGTASWALTRLHANGTRDTGFASPTTSDAFHSLALDASDRILAVGSRLYGTTSDALIVRYTSSGTLDGTFGTSGETRFHGDGKTQGGGSGPVVESDGHVAFLSQVFVTSSLSVAHVLRVDEDGVPDSGFGNGGFGTAMEFGSFATVPTGLDVAPDGGLLAVGQAADGGGSIDWFAVKHAN